MIRRREFLAALAAAAATPTLSWADAGNPAFLAAAKEADGSYALHGLAGDGADLFRIPLPARGHAGTAHPTAPEAVAFARRPGTFGLVIDCVAGKVQAVLESPEGRHFYGHGCFIAGGDILCTAENDFATGSGVIGLWSRAQGYRRIGEIPSHAIGPHEILALEGDVLVVANGGILTHPDHGREKLNIPTMRPSLAYLTPDGTLLDMVELPEDLHRNSIRHIAARPDGLVAFAMQWQGEPMDGVPLLGLHRRGGIAQLAEADLGEQLAMQGYAGSVAFDGSGDFVGITSPVGGRLHVFDADGGFVASHARSDICGLARRDSGFLATDGQGGIWQAGVQSLGQGQRFGCHWDNHVVTL
ncbi:DUF1513 domain-containing protein [Pseudooceanicola algae]|uniref:Twin-arginine translocation pathway signal n=1 Tax=Pseudooceanicola algae TaxID=1537215 RepID=A0A418SEQ3_9RHOB|nr:DUF1513 domain-containing protein [Pseudooceanicola algae]QPM90200.1 hypothetical protein PSAL_014350 [Pseudooceanicola algae]